MLMEGDDDDGDDNDYDDDDDGDDDDDDAVAAAVDDDNDDDDDDDDDDNDDGDEENKQKNNDNEEENDDHQGPMIVADDEIHENMNKRMYNQTGRIRTQCILRLSETIDQFHKVFKFTSLAVTLFNIIEPLVAALPESVASSSKQPALLILLHSLVCNSETAEILVTRDDVIMALIECISRKCAPHTSKMIMAILNALLEHDGGKIVLPHSGLVVECFIKRFVGLKTEIDFTKDVMISEIKYFPMFYV